MSLMTDTPITTPAITTRDGLINVAHNNDPAAYLGRIVFTSVHEGTIQYDDVARILAGLDLGAYTPKRTADSDTFRKVTTGANKLGKIALTKDINAKVMVRDVSDDSTEILRCLVIEEQNKAGKRLRYTEAIHLRFDRETNQFSTIDCGRHMSQRSRGLAESTASDLVDEYRARRGTVDAGGLRSVVTKVLAGVHAIPLRSTGGCYFVPEASAVVATRLERLTPLISTVDVAELPMVDSPKQRDMVTDALSRSVIADCDSIASEMAEMLDKKSVSKRRMTTLMTQHEEVLARAEVYRSVLAKDLSDTTLRLDMMGRQLKTLVLQAS